MWQAVWASKVNGEEFAGKVMQIQHVPTFKKVSWEHALEWTVSF